MTGSRSPKTSSTLDRPESGGAGEGTLASLAYRLVREDILSGALAPGKRLRTQELRQRYEMGTAPLREALARLQAEALVTGEDHRGFWVAPLSLDELNDLTRMRMLLEGEALRDSIEKGGDAWEGNLLSTFHQLSLATKRGAQHDSARLGEWEARHEDFHEALISASGSSLLMRMRAQLSRLVHRYRIYALLNPGERDLDREHREIMEAALDRDAKTATALLSTHYDMTTRIIVENFGDPAE